MNDTGYSGTPLAKKLGIGQGCRVLTIAAPADYPALLEPMPAGVEFAAAPSAEIDVAHLFATKEAELQVQLQDLRRQLRPDAALWVSWPKKSAKVPTDITEEVIRKVALPLGWVDIKVCAVTEIWSGLKLVVRKELR